MHYNIDAESVCIHVNQSTFISRVVLKNYKSIAQCNVRLGPLTFLVGPNGAGKSNFLDAFRFVSDSLRTSLDHSLRERGGIKEVRRRSGGHPTHFSLKFDFRLPSDANGTYYFRIGARPQGGYEVQEEDCSISGAELSLTESYFKVRRGEVTSSVSVAPAASVDRLYLVNASGLPEFRDVYEALSRMGSYSLNPTVIRELQQPDAGDFLARDGRNIASVLSQLATHARPTKERIQTYLSKVVPGVMASIRKSLGRRKLSNFGNRSLGLRTHGASSLQTCRMGRCVR